MLVVERLKLRRRRRHLAWCHLLPPRGWSWMPHPMDPDRYILTNRALVRP